ncbi:putative urea ABC transporter substrate-binding protein [Hansschlegelia plantiphila]|uniref:ABC transporter substrate-binding protein n=1 Tax=Hansschlegelia plantiphila TaxID=374655 RepID=A0A9W6MVK6_9HYPH|nr:putative urea ABC transporter substrate-binding protein [Hansschlegelia plantiphila]GLK68083.1 ABC transporter substrate-binding protein [Hansschlegelia plantiphila]
MHRFFRAAAVTAALGLGLIAAFAQPAEAASKKTFKLGYSIYVGFEPLQWLKTSGVLKKWADKYGIDVQIVQINDYVGGINQFIAGDLDAFAMTDMDQLTMPAAGGVDSSIFLITDYSNGNDAIVSKTANSVKELEGQNIFLLQYSVSHYLLNRALILNGMKGVGAVKTTNISDAEISAAFISQPDMAHAVSWKPMIPDMVKGAPGSKIIFDSSKIPGEIMDVFVGNTATLKDNPDFAKALTGAWYEALGHLKANDATAAEIKQAMAGRLGTDVAGTEAQMATTHFFWTPAEAYEFLTAAKTKEIWDYVRTFCFEQGLYGQGADSVDAIGIELADKSVLGSPKAVKIRVDPTFAKLAMDGKL